MRVLRAIEKLERGTGVETTPCPALANRNRTTATISGSSAWHGKSLWSAILTTTRPALSSPACLHRCELRDARGKVARHVCGNFHPVVGILQHPSSMGMV